MRANRSREYSSSVDWASGFAGTVDGWANTGQVKRTRASDGRIAIFIVSLRLRTVKDSFYPGALQEPKQQAQGPPPPRPLIAFYYRLCRPLHLILAPMVSLRGVSHGLLRFDGRARRLAMFLAALMLGMLLPARMSFAQG